MYSESESLIYLIMIAIGITSYRGFQDKLFERKYIFDTERIFRFKEYYRLISSGFLHAGWAHLGFNLYAFYVFARFMANNAPWLPVAILLAGIIGGSLLSLYIHRHHVYTGYGASGGVCAVIYASIFLSPNSQIGSFFLPIFIPAWLFALLYLILSTYASRKDLGHVGHDAHIGGALTGVLFILIYEPLRIFESWELFLGVLAISGVFFFSMRNSHLPLSIFQSLKSSNFNLKDLFSQRNRQSLDEKELDRLLGLVEKHGYDQLTSDEKKRLDAISKAMKERERVLNEQKDEYQRRRGY